LFSESPTSRSIALWTGLAVLALIVLRWVYVAAQQNQLTARAHQLRAVASAASNPWAAAQRMAAEGRYTDAAHYLYAALLKTLARRERLALHASKTAGDYVRDLRSRSSQAYTPFRQFVRAFEFVAYGTRECDRAQFEQLRALAEPMLGTAE
jgi:hypothetical protein